MGHVLLYDGILRDIGLRVLGKSRPTRGRRRIQLVDDLITRNEELCKSEESRMKIGASGEHCSVSRSLKKKRRKEKCALKNLDTSTFKPQGLPST